MINDMMIRLLEYDEKSPSRYSIVGYAHIIHGQWFEGHAMNDCNYNVHTCKDAGYYLFHAMERGIKVGDEWWFEGDIVTEQDSTRQWTLVWRDFGWVLRTEITGYEACYTPLIETSFFKRIGNIHEVTP